MTSTTPTFTKFAIAGGAGGIGTYVTSALIKQGATVVVLSRKPVEVPKGASLAVVDYADKAALERVFQEAGTEVVVSTLSGAGIFFQPGLADAAKKAGVKHFVPSEFGMRTKDLANEGLDGSVKYVASKIDMHEHLRALDLPYTLYYVGLFSDWLIIPLFGFDLANGKITIIGSGNTPISWTSRADIAHFLAYTLTHSPLDKLTNTALHVEGERLSYLQVSEILADEFNGGKPYEIVHTSAEEAEAKVKNDASGALVEFINLGAEKGWLDNKRVDNGLVPGWTPQTFRQGLKDASA